MGAGQFSGSGPFDLRALGFSLVRVDSPAVLPIVVLAVAVVGTWAERLMGGARTLLAYAGGGLVTSAVGMTVGVIETKVIPALPLGEIPVTGASPVAALVAVVMAASCFEGALWRRRIRVFCVVLAVTLFLYAASASDLHALIALPIGLAMGMLTGGHRVSRRGLGRSSHHETRVLLSALTAITAVGPIVATLWGSGAGLLSAYGWLSYDPLVFAGRVICALGSTSSPCPVAETYEEVQPNAGLIAVLPLVVLLVAAWGILRGRRGALGVAIGLNLIVFAGMTAVFVTAEPGTLALLAQVRGTDAQYVWQTLVGLIVAAVVPLAVATSLFACRRAVAAPSTTRAWAVFLSTVSIAAGGTMALYAASALAAADDFSPRQTTWSVLRDAPLRLLPPSLLPADWITDVPRTPFAQVLWYLPSIIFWAVCVWATVRLILGAHSVRGLEDRLRARELVHRGCSSLGFMTTWPGNEYWFAADADAAFAYRVQGRVAVTLGGAFGADRNRADVARAFAEFCGDNGWTPVFYSVDNAATEALKELHWQKTRVADEATLDPRTWTPVGKKRQDIRTAANRAHRENVRAQWVSWAELTLIDRVQLREISEEWVSDKAIPEMGFTLGTLDEAVDPAARLMLARDATDRIVAVTTWIPIFDADGLVGYALDVMRRRHDAMNGVMEFVIGAVVDRLRDERCTVLSLSGSPLAAHRDEKTADLPAVDRLLEVLSGVIEPAYGFRSLANFKKKFQPEFTPLWIMYPESVHLPAIALALLRCYIPGLTIAGAARLAGRIRRPPRP